MLAEVIRDIIVTGVRSAKLSERLELHWELTLQKSIERVRQTETATSSKANGNSIESVRVKQNQETNKIAKEDWSARCSRCPKWGGSPYQRWYKYLANKEIWRKLVIMKNAVEIQTLQN